MPLIDNIQIVGHVCHDVKGNGFVLGGTASYCSFISKGLCDQVYLITSYGDDFLFEEDLVNAGIHVNVIPSSSTTLFKNIYKKGHRIQYLFNRASEIPFGIGDCNRDTRVILLCPITDEVNFNPTGFKKSSLTIAATIQGWLRAFGSDGKVKVKKPDMTQFNQLDIAIMSDDDITGLPGFLDELVEIVPMVAVTKGYKGADIYLKGDIFHFPSFITPPIDLTGAGDVFAVSFICSLAHESDLVKAASFAHAAASLSIETIGITDLPSLEQIQERQRIYLNEYL